MAPCATPYRSWYRPWGNCYRSNYVSSFNFGWGYGFGYVDPISYYEPLPVAVPVAVSEPVVIVEPQPVVVEAEVGYLPTSPPVDAVSIGSEIEQAAAVLRQGDDEFQRGNYDAARRLYTEGLRLDDSNGFAHVAYMLPLFVDRDYVSASAALRQALTLEPTLLDQPLNVRAMYSDTAAFDAHRTALSEHVSRQSGDLDALFLLSYLAYGDGDTTSAAAALDDFMRQRPGETLAPMLRDAVGRAAKGAPISSQPQGVAPQS